MDKIKIAFVGQFYPVFMGRYILEALLRREDCEVFTIGPFTNTWIPWKGGMHVPAGYVFHPDIKLPPEPMQVTYGFVSDRVPWQPDLWLEVNSTLKVIGRPPTTGKYVVIGTDPHVPLPCQQIYDERRTKADHFFCMQRPYMKTGDEWLPYGYDPIWHARSPVKWEERTLNAALCGLQYPERIQFFNHLKGRGHQFYFDTGPAYDDARAIYHQTKIGFNYASAKDTTARVFEVMAMGLVPLFNRVPDLMYLFNEGEDFVGFDTVAEAVSYYHYLLEHPSEAQAIMNNAAEVVKPHSWDDRAETILKVAGLIE